MRVSAMGERASATARRPLGRTRGGPKVKAKRADASAGD